jgi:histone deacetylase 4/5
MAFSEQNFFNTQFLFLQCHFFNPQLPCGGIGVDSDTYFNDASTQTAAKTAVGSLVELCCQVVEGKLRNGFACIRPPGHHAEREQAMGFCFFNNVSPII